MCNARNLLVTKHVGLNNAADSFMTGCYAGAMGGLVVVIVDDPGMFFSQNEQDSRYYGLHGLIPVFEPSTPGEAKEMTKYAFEFSEKFESLVLLRITAAFCGESGEIQLGDLQQLNRAYRFDESQRLRWTHLPTNARVNRIKLLDRMKAITELADEFPFNLYQKPSTAKIGIITSGIMHKYVSEILHGASLDNIALCKLGMTYPLPEKKLILFMKGLKKIIIIEELEPILETAIKALAQKHNCACEIVGKRLFPRSDQITYEFLTERISEIVNDNKNIKNAKKSKENTIDVGKSEKPKRIENHRELLLKAINAVEKRKSIRFIRAGDIDCDTLNPDESPKGLDLMIAMGASIGVINGVAKLDKRISLAIMEDLTFYHSGLSALINAIYNRNDMAVVILDSSCERTKIEIENQHPILKLGKDPRRKMDLIHVLEGIGIPSTHIITTKADNLPHLESALEKIIPLEGIRVIVSTIQGGN